MRVLWIAVLLAVLTSHLRALGAFVSKRYVSWRAAPRSADLVRMVITHALCTHAAPRTTPNTVSSGQDDVQARAKEEARHGESGETHLHSVSRHAFDATLHVVPRPRQWGRHQARPPSRQPTRRCATKLVEARPRRRSSRPSKCSTTRTWRRRRPMALWLVLRRMSLFGLTLRGR